MGSHKLIERAPKESRGGGEGRSKSRWDKFETAKPKLLKDELITRGHQ